MQQVQIWKSLCLSPSVRLNLDTKGFTISFGYRGIGWITFERRGIRETLDTGIPDVYLSEGQRWHQIAAKVTARRRTGSGVADARIQAAYETLTDAELPFTPGWILSERGRWFHIILGYL
jgi:hypothetical protein